MASFNIAKENLELLFVPESPGHGRGYVEKLRRLVVDLDRPTHIPRSDIVCPLGLNNSQSRAIRGCFGTKDYSLILGMPGTGKTQTLAALITVAASRAMTVLLCSHTHAAVDNVLLRLRDQRVRGQPIDFVRLGRPEQVDRALHEHLVTFRRSEHGVGRGEPCREDMESRLANAAVVATTCLGVGHAALVDRTFDLVVVDEAGQVSEVVCLGPLRFAKTSFVLCGDPYQLSPLMRSAEASESGGDVSLFQRLYEAHPSAVFSLEEQYRMSEDIMSLSNKLVYNGRMRCASAEVAHRVLPLGSSSGLENTYTEKANQLSQVLPWIETSLQAETSVLFLDTDGLPAEETGKEGKEGKGGSICNATEAIVSLAFAATFVAAGAPVDEICIISPYRAQLSRLRNLQKHFLGGVVGNVQCLTIDQAQGRDKECVIVSFVRSNENGSVGHLLKDWRRLNVALTRAKSKLILVGSASTLRGGEFTGSLVTFVESRGWMARAQVLDMDFLPAPSSDVLTPSRNLRVSYTPNHNKRGRGPERLAFC
eukprot:Plantae.Rhodophyta-Rhodochaete_pulchella.ctg4799.p1 GENE.Plantae.Rhodophyta-Rhodochaete_pulchella.ctg4799~~Plantae.Rhodophyta-Rhodochaete_pulchella.ctg4799.p1  ORF type:complete len:606 (+),score=70.72 Plantae.Rhodophyta-Rhodochaete_pulchella.ctg4799:210-1820(+)